MDKKIIYVMMFVMWGAKGFASEKMSSDMEISPSGIDHVPMELSNEDLLLDAVKNGNQENALVLIKNGADITRFTTSTGWSELMIYALSNSNFDVALKLIEKGLSVQCVNSDGATYAHAMAYEENIDSLRFLSSQGLDLDSHGVFFCDTFTYPGIKIERPVDIALTGYGSRSEIYKFLYEPLCEKRKKETDAKKKKMVKKLFR